METSTPSSARSGGRRRAGRTSFPVTVTQLPVMRCEVCGRRLAHRAGDASTVLTAHYEREHPDLLGR